MNPAACIPVSRPMLTKAMREHLLLIVNAGGAYTIRTGPMFHGAWNRTCGNTLRARGYITIMPGRDGVPPVATITAAGLAALGVKVAA